MNNTNSDSNTYVEKLRHIIPTFLIVVFSTLIGLALVRWLFSIRFYIIDIKEEIWEIWIPMIFPWIPITLWLRQRFRVLTFRGDTDKGRFFYQFLSWGVMIAMLFISQSYLTTATGKLQTLATIDDMGRVEKSRYYKITNFVVADYYGGSHTDFRTTGKRNQHLNITVFFVYPILNDTAAYINPTPKSWYGVKFKKQINNKQSSAEKEEQYNAFYKGCLAIMNTYDFRYVDHFERTPTSTERTNFLKAIESRINRSANERFVVLEPVKESYESRNGDKLPWIFGSFGIGFSVLLFALLFPGYSERERQRLVQGKKPKQDDVVDMLKYLIPRDNHFVTSIILDVNILVFLLMVLSGIDLVSPNGQELMQWGANRRPETTSGEWWRLLTSMFVQGGIMHLLLNVFGLVLAAIVVEPILGRRNYSIVYILSGLCGGLSSIYWYSHTASAGASGAIFGLYGAILGLLLTDAFHKDSKKGMLILIGIYVGVNLIWGLTGDIDNAAHIGGLLSGTILGFILYKLDNKKI
jgi:rhomboid protease GluP